MPSPPPSAGAIVRRILDSDAGRAQPHAVLFRFAWWQLWRRCLRRPLRFRTATGSTLALIPGASESLSGFWYFGLPDFEELAFVLHLLRPEDLLVDVGANQGGWTLVAAGRGARVLAFEPIPLTFRRLCDNVAANPEPVRQRIRAFDCGLSDTTLAAAFTASLDVGNHRIQGPGQPEQDVVTVALDRADNRLRGESPVVLKIDVEGEELAVLRGATETLAKPSLLAVVMETFRPQNFRAPALIEAEALLARHGFVPVRYEPRARRIVPLVAPSDGSQNTIYIRNPEAVRSRIESALPLPAFGHPY